MKKLLGLTFGVLMLSVNVSHAQQVGTIGVGDINYKVAAGDKLRPQDSVINALNRSINEALARTRKFTVLDYAQLNERITEQGRNLDGFYNKEYDAAAYAQAGLDYILTADVTEFGLYKQQRGKSENAIGLVDIDFKLIGVADVTADIESSVSAQVSTRVKAGDGDASQAILDKAMQKAVGQLTDQIISRLFPIRIVKIADDGAITLNYGKGLFTPGDTVLIFPKDANIVIDESGDAIGDSIGTVQIISTKARFAIAQALDGQDVLEKGQKGHLLLTDS